MVYRPRTKAKINKKVKRCAKCGALCQAKRCKRCHRVQ